MSGKKSLVGQIVLFVPKSSVTFPFRLNGASKLPAIVIQDFGEKQNLSVFTPYDGVQTAWSVSKSSVGTDQDSWDFIDTEESEEIVKKKADPKQPRTSSGKFGSSKK